MASLDEIAGLVGMNRDDAISSFGRIRWDDYVRSNGFVTKEEVEVLTRNEQGGLDATLGDADETRRLVLVLQKVLDKIKSDRTVQQYALTRIDDILSGKSDQKLLPPRPEVLGAGELAQVSSSRPLFELFLCLCFFPRRIVAFFVRSLLMPVSPSHSHR